MYSTKENRDLKIQIKKLMKEQIGDTHAKAELARKKYYKKATKAMKKKFFLKFLPQKPDAWFSFLEKQKKTYPGLSTADIVDMMEDRWDNYLKDERKDYPHLKIETIRKRFMASYGDVGLPLKEPELRRSRKVRRSRKARRLRKVRRRVERGDIRPGEAERFFRRGDISPEEEEEEPYAEGGYMGGVNIGYAKRARVIEKYGGYIGGAQKLAHDLRIDAIGITTAEKKKLMSALKKIFGKDIDIQNLDSSLKKVKKGKGYIGGTNGNLMRDYLAMSNPMKDIRMMPTSYKYEGGKKKRKLSEWNLHVKKIRKQYPNLSFKVMIKKAKASYKKGGYIGGYIGGKKKSKKIDEKQRMRYIIKQVLKGGY